MHLRRILYNFCFIHSFHVNPNQFQHFSKLLFRIANRGEQNRNFDYILWAVALNLFLQHWSYLKFCVPNFSSFTNVLKIYFLNDQRTAQVCTKSFELFLQGAKNIKDNIQTNKQWRSSLKRNWHLCSSINDKKYWYYWDKSCFHSKFNS